MLGAVRRKEDRGLLSGHLAELARAPGSVRNPVSKSRAQLWKTPDIRFWPPHTRLYTRFIYTYTKISLTRKKHVLAKNSKRSKYLKIKNFDIFWSKL